MNQIVRIRDGVNCLQCSKDSVYILSKRSFLLNDLSEKELQLVVDLNKGISSTDLKERLSEVKTDIYTKLLSQGLLVQFKVDLSTQDSAIQKTKQWLSEIMNLESNPFEKIGAVVLGCGGTGSHVATDLCSLGVQNILLIDRDNVEVSNLNRQYIFSKNDVGRSKVESLKKALDSRFDNLNITTIECSIDSLDDFKHAIGGFIPTDIFCCADTPTGYINAWVAEVADILDVRATFGAVGTFEGTVGPTLTTSPAKKNYALEMRKIGTLAEKLMRKSQMSSSTGVANSLVSHAIVNEWVKYILGKGSGLTKNQSCVLSLEDYSIDIKARWWEQ